MNKKKMSELIELFISEIKNLPEIEEKTKALLKKLEEPYKPADLWKEGYQRIVEIEDSAKKILETLTPLTEVPVGIEDSYIILRTECEKTKEKLIKEKKVDEKSISAIEVCRRNFVARVRNFIANIEKNERRNLKKIIKIMEENHELKKKILELRLENEKLKRKIKEK